MLPAKTPHRIWRGASCIVSSRTDACMRRQTAPPHSRCAIYNGRRTRSLLAPIHGYMPFIHEWHGVSSSEYTRMARSRWGGRENSLCAKAHEKGAVSNYCYSMARQDKRSWRPSSFSASQINRPTIANIDLRSYKMAFDLHIVYNWTITFSGQEARWRPRSSSLACSISPCFSALLRRAHPRGRLVRVVDSIVDGMDRSVLESAYPGGGASAYDPR